MSAELGEIVQIICKDDKIFKETLIEYKAYLMKSGYKEVHIDQKFIPFAVKKKRNKLLRPSTDDNNRKSDHREIKKCKMIIDYEPTFPDIRVAFRKFKSRLEDDEELKEIFPKGIKHLQVSERRGAKNMKEILAPSFSAENSADTAEGGGILSRQ